jgi:hypothetical protein
MLLQNHNKKLHQQLNLYNVLFLQNRKNLQPPNLKFLFLQPRKKRHLLKAHSAPFLQNLKNQHFSNVHYHQKHKMLL